MIKNTNHIYKDELKNSERFAIWITERIGTIGFFFIIVIWTVLWLGWNMFAPQPLRFDPFPGFVLWLFVSNMIQIMLMPLIMVGQNLQAKRSEIRAENDFNVNIKAEKEISSIMEEIKELKEMISKLTKDNR
ncbi:DUF1003 domain-containing protein [Bizionia arctica]|uniref:DUF1003 domain-containing protein n=1 Tax=Bizionia arctica TaxID=1495645 RepID=A0A917GBY2_9FLAO|nr:DUF1003 domain-containing protein [Bizionia arctica]GGG37144.1 hypothetical protein GCM10010976_06030 [Bizionia arctica]